LQALENGNAQAEAVDPADEPRSRRGRLGEEMGDEEVEPVVQQQAARSHEVRHHEHGAGNALPLQQGNACS